MELNKPFKPSENYRSYLYTVTGIIWVPLLLFFGTLFSLAIPRGALILGAPLLVLGALLVWWVGAYYRTVEYKVDEKGISWKRGVIFHKTSLVPYSRVTNIDISQGPLERAFGISTVHVQTAGYSGQTTSTELKVSGLENPGELEELLSEHVE